MKKKALIIIKGAVDLKSPLDSLVQETQEQSIRESQEYTNPDRSILAKFNLKKIRSNDKDFLSYKGLERAAPHVTIHLSFYKGYISIEEEHDLGNEISKRGRLFRIKVNNDKELDILLKQTYPLWYLKPHKLEL
jgi:hypothetical protein